jgi:hypothetical protein
MTARRLAWFLLSSILCVSWTWAHAVSAPRIVHVFVALADNQHQGIVKVAAKLGNGDDPQHNLYWGSAYGMKTYFARSAEWKLVRTEKGPRPGVLERCMFKHRDEDVWLIADAYQGSQIKKATTEFLEAAAGVNPTRIEFQNNSERIKLDAGGAASLVVYIGHDGLMDFQLASLPKSGHGAANQVIILACASKQYFGTALRASGAYPLLWTTNLMAPEAYTLKSALDGWIAKESHGEIRERAAAAYSRYQRCGVAAAKRLLVTGW